MRKEGKDLFSLFHHATDRSSKTCGQARLAVKQDLGQQALKLQRELRPKIIQWVQAQMHVQMKSNRVATCTKVMKLLVT